MKKNNYTNLTLGGQKWIPAFIAGINKQLCTNCYACMNVCPSNVFAKTVKGTVEALHRDRCVGCNVCRRTCPENAITCLSYEELKARNLLPGS